MGITRHVQCGCVVNTDQTMQRQSSPMFGSDNDSSLSQLRCSAHCSTGITLRRDRPAASTLESTFAVLWTSCFEDSCLYSYTADLLHLTSTVWMLHTLTSGLLPARPASF